LIGLLKLSLDLSSTRAATDNRFSGFQSAPISAEAQENKLIRLENQI
jgi:hypothetical protein